MFASTKEGFILVTYFGLAVAVLCTTNEFDVEGVAIVKILSWNVAGLRACIRKGFYDAMRDVDPDVICLQEVKATPHQVDLDMPGYTAIWNPAEKAGYSGTMILSRVPVQDHILGFGLAEHQTEGRSITVDLGELYLVTAYVPNSKEGLARLPYRLEWERDFQHWLGALNTKKPVVLCGDLNVAHQEIDIARPDSNHFSPGFSDEERAEMTRLLSSGFVDIYRQRHPDVEGAYTYWSYFGKARERNTGWRLDYFIISERLVPQVTDVDILSHIQGSDHCPITLTVN